ncbi:uncharacterized protein T551_02551 [Pneumocystis jirovecii RU7]|uniref:Uncharacterized protein n=1 Tax=Pneumocystis jirovecii (strain RU7) TaxID=1408657 RepID=A0A0W4ZK11_PNEJ7|nr:uncharacterized protein T551_02551 [Pneumocystis jirovecii RU7]KTW28701.1 hypothetical protein T551_02551 [Pneumocystis jirovecii RU7]
MPRPVRHTKSSVLLEYGPSFSSGPQASSTPTQDPSNITWTSDLSPIETSEPNRDIDIQTNTSPDPFGFKEIQGIHPTLKIKHLKPLLNEPEVSDETPFSDFSSLSKNKSPFQESSSEEDSSPLPKQRSIRAKPKNLKYKENENENDNYYHKKKKKYTKKHQNASEVVNMEDKVIILEKDTNEFDIRKHAISSKSIIEYFKEVDKFELDVEDVPANHTSD